MATHRSIYFSISLAIVFFFAFPFTAAADAVGNQQSFFVDSTYDAKGRSQVNATLRSVSQKAYFYVADDYWISLTPAAQSQLQQYVTMMGNEFDTRIYPIETAFFGSDPQPGVDGDPRITFLITSLRANVGGYFDSTHMYAKDKIPNSNAREMLYLNASQIINLQRIYPFIAHEFQHLISFNQKELLRNVTDDVWLNELRSEYTASLLGYSQPFDDSTLQHRLSAFLESPSDSLTEWPNVFADYGQAALFGEYVADQWSSHIVANTMSTSATGISSLNEALLKSGFFQNIDQVFGSWMIANYLNNLSLGPRYGYTNDKLSTIHTNAQVINSPNDAAVFSFPLRMKDWEQRWFDVQNITVAEKNALQIRFQSFSALPDMRVAYLVFYQNGSTDFRVATIPSAIPELIIPELGTKVSRVVIMPYTRAKISGFSANESYYDITMTVQRTQNAPIAVTPEQFGLHEGDFIRAEADKDIYIINQYGYKRIVLSPQICLQYGHLGARGCFSAVRMVTPAVRDAFKTSPYYTNGETRDGKIFQLIETGEDSAYLQLVARTIDNSVFFINTREQRAYTP